MPIPKKETNETSSKFISRCMSDEKMVTEYPNEKIRYAICVDQVETLRIVRKSMSQKLFKKRLKIRYKKFVYNIYV